MNECLAIYMGVMEVRVGYSYCARCSRLNKISYHNNVKNLRWTDYIQAKVITVARALAYAEEVGGAGQEVSGRGTPQKLGRRTAASIFVGITTLVLRAHNET